MASRSRMSIPGGTSSFDLPAYHPWKNKPAHERQADLQQLGTQCLKPLSDALGLLLGLLRQTGSPKRLRPATGSFSKHCLQARPTSCCACASTQLRL